VDDFLSLKLQNTKYKIIGFIDICTHRSLLSETTKKRRKWIKTMVIAHILMLAFYMQLNEDEGINIININ
jgi:hypothetical protein